jgi:hypothetical protein
VKKYDYMTVTVKEQTEFIKNLDSLGEKGYRIVATVGRIIIMEREQEQR